MTNSILKARPKPLVLCILDGWGVGEERADNALLQANTPFWEHLLECYPHCEISTSGLDVGLPEGQMGNSEVGHMNIGSGRVVMQELPRIDQAIADGSLAQHATLHDLITKLKASKGRVHLLGLLSDGGVHAHQAHMEALALMLADASIPVVLHGFLDGRDTPPKSALGYIDQWEARCGHNALITVGTISGRYYAMDRDKRWDRVEKAYRAMVHAQGEKADNAREAVTQSYAKDVNDEFVSPTVINNFNGMQEGDAIIMANFRSDRAREILSALLDPAFDGFTRAKRIGFVKAIGMVEYSDKHNQWMETFFPPQPMNHIFPEIISKAGLTQLRIAETEKYAHVTFFFSGGREEPFPGETRILIPSPNVPTYDLKPEMSAYEVTDAIIDAIEKGQTDVVIVNYANGDMVGHTGNQAAAAKAAEVIDGCLAKLVSRIVNMGGVICITADHGNLEQMLDETTGQAHTAHTTNPVPFIIAGANVGHLALSNGKLADIAPTLLALLQLPKPEVMTGQCLITLR